MMKPTDSIHILRLKLGEKNHQTIDQLDPYSRERSATSGIKRKLIKEHELQCAVCRVKVEKSKDIIAAHIEPLEIGGKTAEENIILLCKECHNRYDNGQISIQSMRIFAKKWRFGRLQKSIAQLLRSDFPPSPSTIEPIGSPKLKKILENLLPLQRERKYLKAVEMVDQELNKIDNDEWDYLIIKRAELNRRRTAKGVIDKSLRTLKKINLELMCPAYIPIYYYELGYVLRLRGYHRRAAEAMRNSAEASIEVGGDHSLGVDYVAPSVNEVLCLIAEKRSIGQNEAKRHTKRLNKLEVMASKLDGYWAGRWQLNIAANKLAIELKADNSNRCRKAMDKLCSIYYHSDLSNGWDLGARPTISLLRGLTLTIHPEKEEDLTEGIGLLARAVITRFGKQQRSEGIRDAGFGLVNAVRKAKIKSTMPAIDEIEKLMKVTLDGTSILWPWREE